MLEPGSEIVNSVISGPGDHRRAHAHREPLIGPFTSIDHDCQIIESEIAGSVVIARIKHLGHRIEQSLIGRNVN